jgi:hypothetical protein
VGWVTTNCERAVGKLIAASAMSLVASMVIVRYE